MSEFREGDKVKDHKGNRGRVVNVQNSGNLVNVYMFDWRHARLMPAKQLRKGA